MCHDFNLHLGFNFSNVLKLWQAMSYNLLAYSLLSQQLTIPNKLESALMKRASNNINIFTTKARKMENTKRVDFFRFFFVLSFFRVFVIRLYFLSSFMNNPVAMRLGQMLTTDIT